MRGIELSTVFRRSNVLASQPEGFLSWSKGQYISQIDARGLTLDVFFGPADYPLAVQLLANRVPSAEFLRQAKVVGAKIS